VGTDRLLLTLLGISLIVVPFSWALLIGVSFSDHGLNFEQVGTFQVLFAAFQPWLPHPLGDWHVIFPPHSLRGKGEFLYIRP
jgi:hypothetical protein